MSLTVLVLSYALIKLNHLVTHNSPNISTFPTDRVYDESTPFDLNSSTLKPAFMIQGVSYDDWGTLIFSDLDDFADPRYVKLVI